MPSMLTKRNFPFGHNLYYSWPTGVKAAYYASGVVVSVSRTEAEKMPITALTLTSIVVGSSVGVYTLADVLITALVVASTSVTIDIQYVGDVKIEVRKGNGSPTYKPWRTQLQLTGLPISITALQELD